MFAKLIILFTILAFAMAKPQYYPGYGYSSYSNSYPGYYGYSGYSNPLSYSGYGGYGSYSGYPYSNGYGYY
ncbi:uncharacterized protein [Choristoneura fumiferana]|uniref:uncharacterized protein n=1 Tax=Choristoneura fumiferana TaxID=7141 RepID=UPI003D15D668